MESFFSHPFSSSSIVAPESIIISSMSDFGSDSSMGTSRSIPYRNAASPGLSIIPEGSNLETPSPDFTRRARDIDRDHGSSGTNKNWSAVAGRWVDEPDNRETLRDGLRYSDVDIADDYRR